MSRSHTVGLLFMKDRPIRFTFQSQPHWCPDGGSLGRLARHLSTPPFDFTSPTLAVSGGIRRLGAWFGAVPGTASRAVRACGLRSSRARGATARRTRCRSHLEGGVGTRWLGPIGTGQRGDPHIARAVAAWLCRRHSEVPLRELAPQLGLSRADSVPKQTRGMDARLRARSGPFCKDVSPPGTRLRVVLWMAHSTTTPHQPALAGQRA